MASLGKELRKDLKRINACDKLSHQYAERLTHAGDGMAIVVICLRCGRIDKWLERERGHGTEARQAAQERNIPMCEE